jgi:hypothetical protein
MNRAGKAAIGIGSLGIAAGLYHLVRKGQLQSLSIDMPNRLPVFPDHY